MSFTTKLILSLRNYFGRDRDERERVISPSVEIEKTLPFSEPFVDEIFAKCYHCGRDVLVSIVVVGTPHHAGVMVDCRECLKTKGIHPDYVMKNPEQAAQIQRWLDGDALGNSD